MSKANRSCALFLLLFLLFSGYQSGNAVEIPNVIYFVYAANGNFGTGVMFKDGQILTVNHINPEGELYVSKQVTLATTADKRAFIVKRDKKKDLVLIRTFGKGTVKFADPKVDEEIVVVGYSVGKKMISHGRIMAIEGYKLFLDTHCLAGSSGSPVFNKNGEFVGLLQVEITDDHMTINGALSSKAIQKFLEEKTEEPAGEKTPQTGP